MEYLVGAGGWAYFQVPGHSPLAAYSKAFNFVEVNSTYYQIPSIEIVKSWRERVPKDFKFSVRAHRSIADEYKFRPIDKALEMFDMMRRVCAILEAEILHFQTPSSFTANSTSIRDMSEFFSSINLGSLRIAFEMRGKDSSKVPREMLRMMQDYNMIHCVDLSKGETPAYDSDILYTRLFGPGKGNVYQPTDKELTEIDARASSSKLQKVVMSFHFIKMYKDAARMKIYKQTNRFPKVTTSVGMTSLEEVLSEDARFPATKQELVQSQGWKLFDYTQTERVRANCILEKLLDRPYTGIDDITEELIRAGFCTDK
jgi:uncharacterized protein YecE (DUF72 family)